MAEIAFGDLLEIYRNTVFDADGGEGVLTLATSEIERTVRTIDADESLWDETNVSPLGDLSKAAVGGHIRVRLGPPRISLGLLVRTYDDLWRAPGAALTEPANYFVIEPRASSADTVPTEEIVRYRAALSVIAVLKEAASYFDEVRREIVFFTDRKVVVPVQFETRDLTDGLRARAAELVALFDDALHSDQKKTLLESAVVQMTDSLRPALRFRHLLRNLDQIADEVSKGYRLFVSSFSYAKIRDQVANARIDYLGKIHKTIVDIQGQLLGIPVATIVVATQLKASTGCDLPFWANLAVLTGAYIFVALLAIAIVNQWVTLTAISEEIQRQRGRIAHEFAPVGSQFEDGFASLDTRIWWHRAALIIVGGAALVGLVVCSFAFAKLTVAGSAHCILSWI